MGRFFYTYKFHIVRALISLLLLLVCGNVRADDNCPTLESVELPLCSPTQTDVAEHLEHPVLLINGERAEGNLTLDRDIYFNRTEGYTANWYFTNDEGNLLASGCKQTFYIRERVKPTPGKTTLTVTGYGGYIIKYMEKSTLLRQIENQPITWSDNCTGSDSINVSFDFSRITNDTYGDGDVVYVDITLTDKSGNSITYTQTVKIVIDKSETCPYLKPIVITGCNISCDEFKKKVQVELKKNNLIMDGFADNLYPMKSGDNYNLYTSNKGTYNCNGSGTVKPGEYSVYLYYYQKIVSTLIDKVCPQTVYVKDLGTPPTCPSLNTISIDASSAQASVVEDEIKKKVSDYDESLDNCSSNSDLAVSYTGESLSAGDCKEVTYYLSDLGTKRSCKATIALPECPNLPQRTKKFCPNDGLGKDELVTFMNSAKPTLQFCDEAIQGTLSTDGLNDKYTSATTLTVKWNFYKDGEIVKTCTQSVVLQEDYNMTCTASDFELEAKENCAANGSAITVPVLNGCYNKYWRHDSWSKDNSNWSETSTLSSTTFKNGDIVYWDVNYGGAKCQSKITVVDKTKPTCASPSATIESCSASIADVKEKFNSLTLGTDNCGIQSYTIDEARTAYTSFTPAADGSDKTYKIYYTVTDINGLTNDGYCTAALTMKGKEAACPDAEMGMLSTNGSFSTSLPEESEWKVESPSTVSVSGNTLTGKLPFNTMTEVKLSTEVCGQKKECTTKIIMIKSATPCTTK